MENLRADMAIRLVEERSRLNFSQSDFASKTGVSREGLRLYETGQRGISAEFLAEAATLGMDVQYVLIGIRSKNLEDVAEKVAPPAPSIQFQEKTNGNTIGFVGQGATVHQINTQKLVRKTVADVKPGELHINDEQAAVLTSMVGSIVDLEAKLKQSPKGHRSVWASLNAHCKVPKYRLIRIEDFEEAKKYLNQWLARLNSMASAPLKSPDAWRKRRYAYIKINAKDAASQAALQAYIARNFKAASLTELSNDELERTYRYVAGRKKTNKTAPRANG